MTDWKLEDPKGKSIDKVREIKGEMKRRVRTLMDEIDSAKEFPGQLTMHLPCLKKVKGKLGAKKTKKLECSCGIPVYTMPREF